MTAPAALPPSGGRLFDSHCHLDPDVFGGDAGVDAAVERARAAGVARMVTIGSGYGLDSAARALQVVERHADVWASLGVHPHDASLWTPESGPLLRRLLAHPRVVAIGEMGLDFHYDNSPRDQQRAAFVAQIRLGLELGLPLVIHDRESGGETFDILRREGAFAGRVLYHCFSGTVEEMRAIVGEGGFVSIPGIVTFKKSDEMRAVAAAAPLDRLLIETDTPFLTPMPHRGKRNEPALVGYVAAEVGRVRQMSAAAVAEASYATASALFGLPA